MSGAPEFIVMAAGSRVLAEIAERHGFAVGARVPCTTYGTVRFTDLAWKRPNRAGYLRAVRALRPRRAVMPDIVDVDALAQAMGWAEEASAYVEDVVLVPKCREVVGRIPERINGARVVWGYSTPTPYGATELLPIEFAGKPVHILGGNPRAQIALALQFRAFADVVSMDNSVVLSMARRGKSFFGRGRQWRRPAGADRPQFWAWCAEVSMIQLKWELQRAGLWMCR